MMYDPERHNREAGGKARPLSREVKYIVKPGRKHILEKKIDGREEVTALGLKNSFGVFECKGLQHSSRAKENWGRERKTGSWKV